MVKTCTPKHSAYYMIFQAVCMCVHMVCVLRPELLPFTRPHTGFTAASHKLRCKASESRCQLTCLVAFSSSLSVQLMIQAGKHGPTPSQLREAQSCQPECLVYIKMSRTDSYFIECSDDVMVYLYKAACIYK